MENNGEVNLIQVEFKNNRKIIYNNPNQFPFKSGDYVVVEAEKGFDLGIVKNVDVKFCKNCEKNSGLNVVRLASAEDMERYGRNRQKEGDALTFCRIKAKERNLDMKVIDVETQYDLNKITFYFTADQRIDFRELVKDLAGQYKTRIELRQIGVRDEAKRFGGIGICGLKLCCTTHLDEFQPICTQYAKEQNLSLNPSKLSGICGRLMCCLMYEKDFYEDTLKEFPDRESVVITEKGRGYINKIDVFNNELLLTYDDGVSERLSPQDLKKCRIEKPAASENNKNTSDKEECEDISGLVDEPVESNVDSSKNDNKNNQNYNNNSYKKGSNHHPRNGYRPQHNSRNR